MRHGEKYNENENEFMSDHINGIDWHIPDNEPNEEIDKWLNRY